MVRRCYDQGVRPLQCYLPGRFLRPHLLLCRRPMLCPNLLHHMSRHHEWLDDLHLVPGRLVNLSSKRHMYRSVFCSSQLQHPFSYFGPHRCYSHDWRHDDRCDTHNRYDNCCYPHDDDYHNRRYSDHGYYDCCYAYHHHHHDDDRHPRSDR